MRSGLIRSVHTSQTTLLYPAYVLVESDNFAYLVSNLSLLESLTPNEHHSSMSQKITMSVMSGLH